MEGVSQEAISLAGHLKLGRLILLFDDNQISIDGPTSLSVSDDQLERFRASNWHVAHVDAHDPEAIALAIENAKQVTDRPSMIACRSIIGYGAPTKQGTASTHGSPLGHEEVAGARKYLKWTHEPFELSKPLLAAWRAVGTRSRAAHDAWVKAASRLDAATRARLVDPIDAETKKGDHRRDQVDQSRLRQRQRQARDASVFAKGDRESSAAHSRHDRWLRRSDAVERHAHQAPHRRHSQATSPAPTSITACASTAWRPR